jgi:hypothetical protein
MSRRRTKVVVAAGALVVVAAAVAIAAIVVAPRLATPSAALVAPRFVDETAGSGLEHTSDGPQTAYIAGGVAVFDCDGDRRPDVYLGGAERPASLYRNASDPGRALRFERVADPATDLVGVSGAYPLDIDADGTADLVVLRAGQTKLLRGLGGCRFERANEAWGVAPRAGFATAFSATWEGEASRPTMAFGYYLELDATGDPAFPCDSGNELFRPDAAGAYGPAIPLAPGHCPLSMLFSDWDGSGRRDLRISNDRQYYDTETGREQLWRMDPGVAPRLYTEDDGWVLLQIWGMGIASHDLTGDALPEVYLTSQGPNMLQSLLAGPSQPTFRDLAVKRGVVGTRPVVGDDPLPSTAWHPQFEDVNNDGFMDLFVSKGNVGQQPDYASRDPSNLYLGQPDGTFVERAEAAGIVSFDRSRGAALADLNADGLLDLVVNGYGAPARVWRNVGAGSPDAPLPMGHWLAVRLAQPGGNRDAIGARLAVRVGQAAIERELVVGGGHIGGQLGWLHLGLGPAGEAQVRVTWPDGEVGPWIRVSADRFVDLERGVTEAVPWSPGGG